MLFVRQFRYPYETVLLELPAGKLDPGENQPLEAAKRELQEETGAIGKNYISLGTFYPSAGFCDEVLHLYSVSYTHLDVYKRQDRGYLSYNFCFSKNHLSVDCFCRFGSWFILRYITSLLDEEANKRLCK